MNRTNIEWTASDDGKPGFTVNPVKYRDGDGKSVWACVKVSAGCAHCYAESLAKRYGRGGPYTVGQTAKVTPYLDEAELRQMLSVKRLPPGSRVFVGDMTDIFGEWVPDEMLDRMFAVFALRPDVVFQVLTKRPERMREYMSWRDEERGLVRQGAVQYVLDVQHARGEWKLDNSAWPKGRPQLAERWPLPNLWLGTSVENQGAADKRIPELLATPAVVRFLSCEPLLAGLEFSDVTSRSDAVLQLGRPALAGIDWVIVGGESGPGARPCDIGWIRSIVAQCRAAGVAVFYKQGGKSNRCSHDMKGGHFECFPDDLKVRELPR